MEDRNSEDNLFDYDKPVVSDNDFKEFFNMQEELADEDNEFFKELAGED